MEIGLTIALSMELDLQSAALLTACHSVKVHKVNYQIAILKFYKEQNNSNAER